MKIQNIDWNLYPSLRQKDFICKYSFRCTMQPEFMDRLQRLGNAYGKPISVTSGFRDTSHPAEVNKKHPGPHTTGRACDIAVGGSDALLLLHLALDNGFTGIGVQQKGVLHFLHLDDLPAGVDRPRPFLWSY